MNGQLLRDTSVVEKDGWDALVAHHEVVQLDLYFDCVYNWRGYRHTMPSPPVSACAISLTWCRRGSGGKSFRKWELSCLIMSRSAEEWRRLRVKGEVVHGSERESSWKTKPWLRCEHLHPVFSLSSFDSSLVPRPSVCTEGGSGEYSTKFLNTAEFRR